LLHQEKGVLNGGRGRRHHKRRNPKEKTQNKISRKRAKKEGGRKGDKGKLFAQRKLIGPRRRKKAKEQRGTRNVKRKGTVGGG